jgi:hypothetical protein
VLDAREADVALVVVAGVPRVLDPDVVTSSGRDRRWMVQPEPPSRRRART